MDQGAGQTTQETTQDPAEPGPATRDDLIAAVREAGGTGSVDVEAEERAAAERAATAPAEEPKTEATAEEEPRIAAVLRAREKAHAEQEAAKNQAQQLIEQAKAEAAKIAQEARERADREWQAELARRKQAFEQSPSEALRHYGTPEQVGDAILMENTPQARALKAIRDGLEETKKQASVAEEVKKELAELKAERAKQAQEAQVAELKAKFFGQHATPEKAPYLHARYDQEEIFRVADALAWKWSKSGLQMGTDFDMDDITQYLELESKKRITALGSTPAQQVSAGAPAKEPGNAPKVPANGTRTLSAAQGSERRTSPKPLSEMSPQEARAALIEEVAAARRANPESSF